MQVIVSFEVDRPAARAGRSWLWKGLTARISAFAFAFLLAGRVESQVHAQPSAPSAVLEGLRETLVSRWEFQKRHPLSIKAFAKELGEAERNSLVARLAAGAGPDTAALDGLWRRFTLGLCAEARRPGAGEADLQAAARMAAGNIPVNFELARILQGAGMFQRALAHQKEVRRAMMERGYARLPELAKMELWRARQALKDGRHQAARHSQEFAGRLDPFAPWVPLFAMELHMRERAPWEWDLGELWARLTDTALQVRHYDTFSLFLLNLSRVLRTGLGLFGCVCVALLAGRHFFRMAHPFAERLPHEVDLGVRYLAIGLVPASLAVGGAGFAVLIMGAAALLWRHSSAQERSILKAVLTGMAIMPLLLLWEQSMGRHLDPATGIHLYHKAYGRGMEPALAAQIAAARPRTNEDSVYAALASSLAFKKQGNLLRAGEGVRDALRLAQLEPRARTMAMVHAGNLSLLAFDFAKASSQYSVARQAEPELLEAWFNGSQAELYANNSSKHRQFLDHAAELDPLRVTAWLKDNDELFAEAPPARRAMDPMLGPGQALQAAWRGAMDLEFLRLPVKAGIVEVRSGWLIAAVALLALGLFLRFRNHSQHIRGRDLFECKICNRVMCRTCRKGVHCQPCFKAVAGVQDTRLRADLVASLRNRARNREGRVGRLLDAILPGAGRLYLGESSGRFAWPLAASLAIGIFWGLRPPLMEYPGFAMGMAAWLPVLPLLLVYGLHHIQFLSPASRLRGPRISAPAFPEKEAVA